MKDLMDHPAVINHGNGVSSADLASFVEALASISQSRIKGIGAEQYEDDGRQQFEDLSLTELAEYTVEEIADIYSYLAMKTIKILALANAAKAAGDG